MDPLFIFIAVVVISIFKWLINAAGDAKKQQPPPGSDQARPRPKAAQTEQERLRKFLQALGVPESELPPMPTAPPPGEIKSVRSAPVSSSPEHAAPQPATRKARHRPVPPLVAGPGEWRMPTSKQPPFLRRQEPVSSIPAPVEVAQSITPEPEDRNYRTPSEDIVPTEAPAEPVAPLASAPVKPLQAAQAGRLGEFLKNPDDLRRAIVLREIFGPPKGLQVGDEPLHSRLA